MLQCQQCGQGNAEGTKFCRFCGHQLDPTIRIDSAPAPAPADYQYSPPRPYSWKTDEYQTQSEPRARNASAPDRSANISAGPLVTASPHFVAGSYRCPNCGTSALPVMERRVSTAGWITFALLLVFTFIFFWIGLLMKETVAVCPVCRATLN